MLRRSLARTGSVLAFLSLFATGAAAQPSWTWSGDANVFVGFNDQERKFADFTAFESQNWFMLDGTHEDNTGTLTLNLMMSLEPLTVGHWVYLDGTTKVDAGGSPQLFQTGESYKRIPLTNVQHPHDLFMELGASYRIQEPSVSYTFSASVVGEPALGPTTFMHRDSARDNPQAPLSHHWLDSTHVLYGVLTGGVEAGAFTIEASTFRGAEPDENRYNIEAPKLDSYSARLRWQSGAWNAQVSAGHLHQPEWFEPYDETRITASIGYDGTVGVHPLAATFAWGENRDANVVNGVSDCFLGEWDLGLVRRLTLYGRAEVVEKEILGVDPFPFQHPQVYSHIDALTLGAVRDLTDGRFGRFGIGGDATVYHMSPDLATYYAGSSSFHAFVRWRPSASAHHHH